MDARKDKDRVTLGRLWGALTGHERTWVVLGLLALFALLVWATNGLLLLVAIGLGMVFFIYMAVWVLVSDFNDAPW
jgi:amino acid permease